MERKQERKREREGERHDVAQKKRDREIENNI